MTPSVLSTSSTRARSVDPGGDTLDLLRMCALRMRAIRSPSGSFRAIARSASPARFDQAGDDAPGAELPQSDAAHPELAIEAARPPGDLAAVANARARGIARQLRQLERGREPLLGRQRLVARDRLEPRSPAGEFLRQLAPPVVRFDRTLLRHLALLAFSVCGKLPHCRNGKLNTASSARASSSVSAVGLPAPAPAPLSRLLLGSHPGEDVSSLVATVVLPAP